MIQTMMVPQNDDFIPTKVRMDKSILLEKYHPNPPRWWTTEEEYSNLIVMGITADETFIAVTAEGRKK